MNPSKSLSTRLVLILSLVLVVAFALYSWVSVGIQRRQFEEDVRRFATTTSDLIRIGISKQMVLLTADAKHRADEIHDAIDAAARQPTVHRIRIFDKRGSIRYSSLRSEIGQEVDEHAEACIGCHRGPVPLEELKDTQRIREFREEEHRMMGLTTPIDNDRACWTCHTSEAKVLGTLDIQMSLDEIDANVRSSRSQLVLWGGVSLAVIAVITAKIMAMPRSCL